MPMRIGIDVQTVFLHAARLLALHGHAAEQ
jgi:hypothetical protein